MKKRTVDVELVLVFLTLCCLASTALLATVSLRLMIAGLILFVACAVTLLLLRNTIRVGMKKALMGKLSGECENMQVLEALPLPVAVLRDKRLVWYNTPFLSGILSGEDATLALVPHVLPGLDINACFTATGCCFDTEDEKYTVYGSCPGGGMTTVLYFVENTTLKWKASEYDATRPVVMHIVLDTYDELKRDLRTADLGRITGTVQDAVLDYIAKFSKGFIIRVAAERYLAVIEERYLLKMIEDRFSVLDTVRAIGGDMGVTTLSIGVSRGAETLSGAEDAAMTALDMALGRGGDQTAIKDGEGSYAFYGGVSRSVEKRSKVKARIIASSLTELITRADNVVVMGHRMSDMDCVGAAMGVLRICKSKNIPACIAINKDRTLAGSMIRRFEEAGLGDEMVYPAGVLPTVSKNSLLIIVDTHVAAMLESPEIFDAIPQRVVIDHHRKMVGFIEDAAIFYHETYASSTCELVSELLQYMVQKEDRMLPVEAEGLLAGIMLDTRDFTVHTGVRTFEAAGYLRRMGAQTANVKQLFAGTLDAYNHKARIVATAQIYRGCAIAASEDLPENMRVVIPQAANDLLSIEGVKASFVAVKMGDTVNISARSMGEVNVQIIMEKMNGGGHMMMAATQIKNIEIQQARALLTQTIDEYWADVQTVPSQA